MKIMIDPNGNFYVCDALQKHIYCVVIKSSIYWS